MAGANGFLSVMIGGGILIGTSLACTAAAIAMSVAARAVLELHTELRVAEPEDMDSERLAELGAEIGRLAGLIADAYFV